MQQERYRSSSRARVAARAAVVDAERANRVIAAGVALALGALGLMVLAGGVHAQPSVPEIVTPRDGALPRPRSENPLADGGTVRPNADNGVLTPGGNAAVIRPPATGAMPVIPPPSTSGSMPVLPPPGTSGGDRTVVPK